MSLLLPQLLHGILEEQAYIQHLGDLVANDQRFRGPQKLIVERKRIWERVSECFCFS